MKIDSTVSPLQRRSALEKNLKVHLPSIGNVHFENDEVVHCENLIGGTVIPLGVAGPLRLKKENSAHDYIIPLATTEGALVASVNRGCKAVTLSGGAMVRIEKVGVTRAPVFEVAGIREAFALRDRLKKGFFRLQEEARQTSSHLSLLKAETKITGRYVYVRFSFDTGKAMGMNMVTVASERLISFIEKEYGTRCLSLSGNYCVDKKPSYLNFLNGRGREGWAEVVVPRNILRSVLKTSSEKVYAVWLGKSVLGSVASGSIGNNAHFANVVAAFYAATGQDLAHVVEGSLGMTTATILPQGSLYFNIYMPAIMLGTVGGGTKLNTKKEALSIMGTATADTLAEVLAGAVLAGELSLLSSLAQGTLAKAHTRLGR